MAVSVFRSPSNYVNGNTRDRQGRLVSCEHGGRRVTRTETDGSITVLADSYKGKRLNSPNDVVVRSDGGVWFTDPELRHHVGLRGPQGGARAGNPQRLPDRRRHVARSTPSSTDFIQPNGLAFSPDETKLYIADSGSAKHEVPRHVRVFDVIDGRKLTNGRYFCSIENGIPTVSVSMSAAISGRAPPTACIAFRPTARCSARSGCRRRCPTSPSAAPKKNRLFITATRSVYSIYTTTNGAQYP
jgi:gluconolactonase